MENYDVNISDDITSYMEEFDFDNPNRKWMCEHYHRERISQEQGIKENRPKEEETYVDEYQSFLLRPYTSHFYSEEEKWKRVFYYDIKVSNLVPISYKLCKCSKCGKIFGIEKIEQMKQIFKQMDELYDKGIYCLTDLEFLKMWQGLEPVWYRRELGGIRQVLGIEKNVRKWTLGGRKMEFEIPDKYTKLDSFVQLPKLKLRFDKEAKGCSHFSGNPCRIVNTDPSSKQLRIIEEVTPTLTTNSKGICKCSECGKVFSVEEQQQLEHLISYLNTPHYWLKEDMKYQDKWKEVLEYYNQGYLDEHEPFKLFNIEKAVELSKGIEPVLFHKKHYNNSRKKILTSYRWKNGKWTIKNKVLAYLKLLISKRR